MSTPTETLLAAALAHAARGWRVFPLRRGDKRPAVKDWEPRATTDPARIERAWTAGPFNIGIATGPSGLVVLDLDRPKPGEIPPAAYRQPGIRDGGDVLAVLCEANDQPLPVDTYAVRTGSGGTHLYFTAPPGITLRNTAKRLGWLIDTRAHGGYVVAAGSTVDRRPYTVLVDEDPAPLPGWLTDRLADPAPTTERVAPRLARRPPTPPRRCAANSTGCSPPPKAPATTPSTPPRSPSASSPPPDCLPRQLADDALTLAGQAIGLPARECAATIRSGLDSGERTPRQPASRDPQLRHDT